MKTLWRHLWRALPWLLTGLVSSALTLLAMAPAYWLAPWVGRYSAHRIELVDPSGSLWHGAATLMLAPGGAAAAPDREPAALPGRLVWDTAFWPLWLGRLHLRLQQDSALMHPITLDLDLHQARLDAGSLNLPANWLTGLGSPFNTLALRGILRLDWSECRVLNGMAYGQLNLTLDQLGSRVSRISPLGSYRLHVDLEGRVASLHLSTLTGALLLDGQGRAGPNTFSFDGSARAAPGFEQGLAGFLDILGDPRGDGSYTLRTMP